MLSHSMATEEKDVIQSTVKHTENKNLAARVCVTLCLCVLHRCNIKRHLPGPEAVLALLPSLSLLLWFISLLSHPSLLHWCCREVTLSSSQTFT